MDTTEASNMKVTRSTSIHLDGITCSVGELANILSAHQGDDVVRFSYSPGYDQRERDSITIVIEDTDVIF